jgi:hypothetical protein
MAVAQGEQLLIAMDAGVTCNGTPLQPNDAVLPDTEERIVLDGPRGARFWLVSITRL